VCRMMPRNDHHPPPSARAGSLRAAALCGLLTLLAISPTEYPVFSALEQFLLPGQTECAPCADDEEASQLMLTHSPASRTARRRAWPLPAPAEAACPLLRPLGPSCPPGSPTLPPPAFVADQRNGVGAYLRC
jgi:hypothetical protein